MKNAEIIFQQIQKQKRQISEKLYGLFRATVEANGESQTTVKENDKSKLGRIKVRIHSLHDKDFAVKDLPWAEYCSPFGGSDDVGFLFVPEVGATVFIMFVNGNPSAPVWIGTWWSYQDDNAETPRSAYLNPQSDYPKNKVLRTKSGHQIEFDDSPLNKGIRVTTSNGNFVHIDDVNNTITAYCKGDYNQVVGGDYNLSVAGNINVRGENDLRTEFANNVDIATKDINISGNINSKGDLNVVAGNVKLHEGSLAVNSHIIAKGKIFTDNDIATLGNIYAHGTILADESIYTKKSFFDKFDKLKLMYTNISRYFRMHTHIGNFGVSTPLINSEEANKEPKQNIVTIP